METTLTDSILQWVTNFTGFDLLDDRVAGATTREVGVTGDTGTNGTRSGGSGSGSMDANGLSGGLADAGHSRNGAADTGSPAGGSKTPEQQEDEDFEQLALKREARKNVVYLDNQNRPTVGIGHLVLPEDQLKVGDTITDEQVDAFWKKDSATAMTAARSQATEAGITDTAFVPTLASVNFQLGSDWTGKFTKTWTLIKDGQYEDAATEAAKSDWNSQTPERVKDFQDALRALPAKLPPPPAASRWAAGPVEPLQ
jgi:GH24 family phage-related lysozyme (muramidase)